jgi:hypothetical protein
VLLARQRVEPGCADQLGEVLGCLQADGGLGWRVCEDFESQLTWRLLNVCPYRASGMSRLDQRMGIQN